MKSVSFGQTIMESILSAFWHRLYSLPYLNIRNYLSHDGTENQPFAQSAQFHCQTCKESASGAFLLQVYCNTSAGKPHTFSGEPKFRVCKWPTDTCRPYLSGAGGSRTLVQTGKPYAFYRLSCDWIVGTELGRSNRAPSLSSEVSPLARSRQKLSPILLHHLFDELRSKSFRVMSCHSTLYRD